ASGGAAEAESGGANAGGHSRHAGGAGRHDPATARLTVGPTHYREDAEGAGGGAACRAPARCYDQAQERTRTSRRRRVRGCAESECPASRLARGGSLSGVPEGKSVPAVGTAETSANCWPATAAGDGV